MKTHQNYWILPFLDLPSTCPSALCFDRPWFLELPYDRWCEPKKAVWMCGSCTRLWFPSSARCSKLLVGKTEHDYSYFFRLRRRARVCNIYIYIVWFHFAFHWVKIQFVVLCFVSILVVTLMDGGTPKFIVAMICICFLRHPWSPLIPFRTLDRNRSLNDFNAYHIDIYIYIWYDMFHVHTH